MRAASPHRFERVHFWVCTCVRPRARSCRHVRSICESDSESIRAASMSPDEIRKNRVKIPLETAPFHSSCTCTSPTYGVRSRTRVIHQHATDGRLGPDDYRTIPMKNSTHVDLVRSESSWPDSTDITYTRCGPGRHRADIRSSSWCPVQSRFGTRIPTRCRRRVHSEVESDTGESSTSCPSVRFKS